MKLYYREVGQGKPLIILHGLFGMSDNWLPTARKLADYFKVYLPDLRNHGQSPHHPDFNYDVLVSDLHSFMKDHGLHKICLAGHSLGGKTAMYYALKFPQSVDKLAVIDMGVKSYQQPYLELLLQTVLRTDLTNVNSYSEADSRLAESISAENVRQFLLKNLHRRENKGFSWRFNASAVYSNFSRITKGLAAGTTYKKSAMFVRGGRSDYIADEDISGIKEMFPAAEIETIENAGHWVHTDAFSDLSCILSEYFR